uniref:disease resistance protein Roq1-like n=1 Tax=Erigeron canadensis TaxID=72917 RepID=UPI001CB965BD|nr:disease resistance protein Roq1-like [Erigeron canadensis]
MDASSSSVVPSRKGWTYDVFLSFRGEDTRNNFVDHLFAALTLKGIHTFKDDKMLGGGQRISEELVKAIGESRWAVVVFSKNYANSSWCLEELSHIMECHDQMGGQKKVLPVFYHVNPSDVRKQKGDFAAAAEGKFKDGEMDKVNKWKNALTAAGSLSGQHILPNYGGESAFISKIVEEILADIQPRGGSRENHLIGIQPRVDALILLLKMEAAEEVRFVGICGMGGIGKTTIARSLFKRIAHKFQGSSFVNDVRENSSSKSDMCTLQERLLSDILGERHGYKIKDCDEGAEIIQERCCRKKVLLVLDDVNDVKQLELLASTREWFGPGSRIIITTRDQHLLSYANANDNYTPALLRADQAVELFSRHAFRKSSPPDGYMDLTNRAINYTHRLPLALKVLGSFLCGREVSVWGSALDTLAKTPSAEVFYTLKLSFDYLNDSQKQIFLDIACFYKGKDVDGVTRILDSFGFDPVIGISVLVEKSLVTISSVNTLDMHDLIKEMAQKVVQATAPNSRLWELEKTRDLINSSSKKELKLVEGIVMPWNHDVDLNQSVSAKVFESMRNLRVLDCNGKFTSSEPSFLPTQLRWLCWAEYPFSSVPMEHMSKLVGLHMVDGKIKHLWNGRKVYSIWRPLSYLAPEVSLYNNSSLKFIHLQWCKSITRFPDVSGTPNIESLDLSFCENLVEVDESVGSLKKLLYWDMTRCSKLKCLPSMLHMESLETLNLFSCDSLHRIPEFSPCMVNLSKLDISGCPNIEEVPLSIRYLLNLSLLDVSYCESLKNIPKSIWELKRLNTLRLNCCSWTPGILSDVFQSKEGFEIEEVPSSIIYLSNLSYLNLNRCVNLPNSIWELRRFDTLCRNYSSWTSGIVPDDFQSMKSMEELHIDSIHIYALTSSCYLRKLYLYGDFRDKYFPINLHGLSSLEELHLVDNSTMIQLPESISHLSSLKLLLIRDCWKFQSLHGLPQGIQVLIVESCLLLEKLEDLSKEYKSLNRVEISDCPKLLEEDEENVRYLDKIWLHSGIIIPNNNNNNNNNNKQHRHNLVRDTLLDICSRSGVSARREVDIGLRGDRDIPLRPADMLLYSWDGGLDVCVDLTGSSPLTQTSMVDFMPGSAVVDVAQRKRAKYKSKCADIGYGFLPFSFSSLEELEKDVVTILKRIRKFSVTQDIGARSAAHIFNRIGFAIARGVRAQIRWAANDGGLMIHIPGSNIPSWFQEQEDGRKIALKLPPNWQAEIVGFAVCFVSTTPFQLRHTHINLIFKHDINEIEESDEIEEANETEEADWNVWIGYIPYSLFQEFHGGKDNDFEGEDWFHMTQVIEIFKFQATYGVYEVEEK